MSYRLSNVNRVKVTCRGRVRASWIVQPNLYDTRSLFRCLPFLLFPFFPSPPFFFFFFITISSRRGTLENGSFVLTYTVCFCIHTVVTRVHGTRVVSSEWNGTRPNSCVKTTWNCVHLLRCNFCLLHGYGRRNVAPGS